MNYGIMVARTYLFMYEITGNTFNLKEALKADYCYSIFVCIEKGWYWNIKRGNL